MTRQELRIGNIALANNVNESKLVDYIIESGSDIDNAKWYWPAPLTEGWLQKLGFIGGDMGYYEKGNYTFSVHGDRLLRNHSDGYIEIQSNIEHVHQLQNLYFALTGEELTLD